MAQGAEYISLHRQRFAMAKIARRTSRKIIRKNRKAAASKVTVRRRKIALSRARLRVATGWDPDARVWYIASSNLPGLHLEGATPQEIYNQLPGAIEDLLEGSGQREVSFDFITPVEIMPGHVKIAA